MRLTHITEYRFTLANNEKFFEESVLITFTFDNNKKDYTEYFIKNSCKARKISNTRCYYVYREERKVGRKRPTEHYFFNLINIKKVIKKGLRIEFIIDKYSFEFNDGYKNRNNDYYDLFYKIDERIDIDIQYRKFINNDNFDTLSERVQEDIKEMDYQELLNYFNQNKEMIEMFNRFEGEFEHFEIEEEKNEANYFIIRFLNQSFKDRKIVKNDKFIPVVYKNYDDEPHIGCGIRDWSDKTEGYI